SGRRVVGELRRPSGRPLRAEDSVLVALGVYSACEGGDGYAVPEAQPACANRKTAPRAVDLLIEYIVDSLKGRIEAPKDSRIVQAGNANPG
ncbi:MAG: hypothetical protein ACXWWK_04990, partial [Gemmatimonadales bacterium]